MVRKYRVSRLYIPIWFYSNPCSSIKTAFNVFFTFQSGSIQINKLDDYTIRYTLLYIPIWFYSNGYYRKLQRVYERSLHSNLVLFKSCINFLWPFSTRTLHSNLVLFKFHFLNTHIHYYVSLHSNLVLFKFCEKNYPRQVIRSLHSNLVLFKFTVSFNILFAQFFTFQSGSIQISVKQMFEFDKISFTFQSGSIQINQEKGINIENELYIPIWFYSNLTGITEIDNDITTLHSNLVLFK